MRIPGLAALVRWIGSSRMDHQRRATSRKSRRRQTLRGEGLESREMMALIAPDLAVFRPSDLTVRIDYANMPGLDGQHDLVIPMQGIAATDIALTGDINGDTINDLAFFRPSTGEWRIDYNLNGVIDQTTTYFGTLPLNDVVPVLGDVSGTGFAALGVYQKSTGLWQFNNGRTFTFGGQAGDVPMLGDMNVDGRADLMVYNPTVFVAEPTYGGAPFNRTGNWRLKYSSFDPTHNHTQTPDFVYSFGPFIQANDKPVLVFTPSPQLGIHTSDVNGTRWLIDTDFNAFTQPPDGPESAYFYASATVDVPLVGYFDTRSSIFVSPNGSDTANGAFGAPLRTINAAVSRAPNLQGQIIRLAAGTYADPVNALFQRYGLTFQGAGPLASVIAPPSGDAMHLNQCGDITFQNVNLRAVGGRGLVALGSNVNTYNINTAGSRDTGGLAVGLTTGGTTIRTNWLAIGSHFDSVTAGDGVQMQGAATGTFSFATFNANQGRGNNGRGLTLFNDSIASVDSCAFLSNENGGVITVGTSDLTLTRSAIANNQFGNGLLLTGNSNALVQSNYFAHNGLQYGVVNGLNGIELLGDYTGLARILGNTFFDSTGFGIFVSGSTQFAEIRGNYFNHSNLITPRVAIGMNGALDQSGNPGLSIARAVIQGNLFDIPDGDPSQEGIFLFGAGVTATIGGAGGSNVNVFRNFAANNAIDPTNTSPAFPGVDFGCPTFNGDAATVNIFVNTDMPYVRPCPL